jgi:tRNA 5-methylaminomethyl-2-thiouridine biosynthesis bifunctional protein
MRLPPSADLVWDEDGAPRAAAFDDVYFSRDGGLEETRAVFLAGCGLPEGWAGRARFAIGELGFGSGLNALATWAAWRATRAPGAVLHYVSVEGFAMSREQAARALSPFGEIADDATRLLAAWPVRATGPQRLWFPNDGFALTVLIGEAEAQLAGLTGAFDAWFLDGFSPARNPALWSPALMARLAALSKPGARAATYSVAAPVREALRGAGFEVAKREGFGAKRQRLEARLAAAPTPLHSLYPYAANSAPERVAILGDGIAGASLAVACVRRGVTPVVFDPAPEAAASVGPAALVMPRLERTDTPLSRLYLGAYLFALPFYESLGVLAQTGVAQRAGHEREEESFAAIAADPPLPEEWLRSEDGALIHPRAGVVDAAAALTAMSAGAARRATRIVALERAGTCWRLRDAAGDVAMEADAVLLACGPGLGGFAETSFLPLRYSRGQSEWGALSGAAPAHAVAASAYAAPAAGGLVFGATFDRAAPDAVLAPSAESREENLAALAEIAPDLAARLDHASLRSRVGLRVSTPDVAPVAGLLPDVAAWKMRFAALCTGAPLDLSQPAPALDGLYALGALSARGFLLAPLLAESIVSELFGEPSPLDAAAREAAHPARFLVRALKRGEDLAV